MSEKRLAVIAEARSWIGTPFHFGARIKGTGVDCAQFIAAVFEHCEIFNADDYGFFGRDWHFHTDVEHYKMRMVRHALELPLTTQPQPGDVALVRVGRVFSHAGIIVEWPMLIHAGPRGVREVNGEFDPMWIHWDKCFFDPYVKETENV
jgi:cell wall-associated NlpC family hydrolase